MAGASPACQRRPQHGRAVRERTTVAGHVLSLAAGAAIVCWAGAGRAEGDPAAPSAAVSAWSTGGASASAKPTDADGKPVGAAAGASPALPYWQAPAVPSAVIQGGAIPPGWQPQAVPYQGIGPDGRPITMYVAPTYVFTYQVGPPVVATPQVNRRQAGVNRPGVPANPYASGWNYRSSGATPVAPVLPPPTVARYAPQPYQFPTDARALTGTPVVPPAALPPPSVPQNWAVPPPPVMAASPPPAWTQPPAGWGPVNAAPANLGPPPAGWTGVAPSAAPAPPPGFAADAGLAATAGAAGVAAGAAAAAAPSSPPPPPLASLPPPVTPIQAAPPPGPQPIPVANASLAPPAASASNVHAWKVVAVYDGDTVTCLDENNQQQKVRLADIDAPESGQDFGKASREALATMVFGRTVQVVDSGRDRFGRWIGRLSVDGTDVNREMVATGMAWHYADYSKDDSLAAVQAQAQAQKIGLWSQPNPIPPADYRRQASQKT
jgi:endonuclease YncB( thermonuclease family)